MPAFKDIKPQYVLNQFKHNKIIAINQKLEDETGISRIEVVFKNDALICYFHQDKTGLLRFVLDYQMHLPISLTNTRALIDEIEDEATKIIAKRLQDKVCFVQHSHRYNMNYNALHRFYSWDELDTYHKCFKLKSLRHYSDFKYILKNWSEFEQYFRTHLWARQCLISFLASRGKLYELSGDKEWILEQTEHFWLYEILIHETNYVWEPHHVTPSTKRTISQYRSSFGDKQNTMDVHISLKGDEPRPLLITGSVTRLSLNFLKNFKIVFGKKSKYSISRISQIYEKCQEFPDGNHFNFLKAILTLNYKSILWNVNYILNGNKGDSHKLKILEPIHDICGMVINNGELTKEEIKNISQINAEIEHFKLMVA